MCVRRFACTVQAEWTDSPQKVESPGLGDMEKQALPTYSDDTWRHLVDRLQGDYSQALYHRSHQVDWTSLNIVWLPLLDAGTTNVLTQMGVCFWEPRFLNVPLENRSLELPLHAPHSPTSPDASVWRHTEQQGIESYGWVEVTHTDEPQRKGRLPWFYVAHGSGVSLNVGRTAIVDSSKSATRCIRGSPKDVHTLPACLAHGLNLSTLDSIQMLHVYDPGDSVAWRHGFRHEILLLRTELLDEGGAVGLMQAAVAGHRKESLPAIMCGKPPSLFPCSPSHPPLQYMVPPSSVHHSTSRSVCSNSTWRAMMRHCGQNLRWRQTAPCRALPVPSRVKMNIV